MIDLRQVGANEVHDLHLVRGSLQPEDLCLRLKTEGWSQNISEIPGLEYLGTAEIFAKEDSSQPSYYLSYFRITQDGHPKDAQKKLREKGEVEEVTGIEYLRIYFHMGR